MIALYEIFAKNDVDLVLNGHAHTFERLKPYDANGIVVFKQTGPIDAQSFEEKVMPAIKALLN